MASDIIPFDPKGKDLPAHLASLFSAEDANLTPRVSINQLSYRGKTFRTVIDGKETQVMRKDPDSDEMVPVQVINVVVLEHNKKRSRAFYEGAFEEGKNAAPRCFSGDGVKPDASVKEPCAATCAECPNAVKGSKVTESGAKVTACASYKRLAVVPAGLVATHPPLLLRIAQTSMWDKENPHAASGWYGFDQYIDILRARGVPHTGLIETRIKFDPDTAYPKLLFSVGGWVSAETGAAVKQKLLACKDEIDGIVNGKQSDDGVTGQPAEDASETPAPAARVAAPVVDEAAVARQAAEDAAVAEAKAKAAAKARKKAELAAALAAVDEDDEPPAPAKATAAPTPTVTPVTEGFGAEPAAPAKAAATPSPSPAVEVIDAGTPASLSGLLADWDK